MRYHANATTNINQRALIQESNADYRTLQNQFQVSLGTIHTWKHRESVEDKASTPHTIHYALTEEERQLIVGFRQMEWHSLDDIVLLFSDLIPNLKRSNCYRTLKRNGVNRKPRKEKTTKPFKQYKPGYVHMDVFYLPKLNGERRYVFVAIDRTTKMVFLEVYGDKSKESSLDFLMQCLAFFPFKIHTILTDNGKEFTLKGFRNRYGTTKKVHQFTAFCLSKGIDHRTTKVKHPWTNGQVERMNGILKERTVKRFHYQNHQEVEQHLKRIQDHWNYYKRHKTLNLKTIPQALKEWYEKEPDIFRVVYHQLPFTML